MVVSHRHRYVFVQTMKTASSAMAAELCANYDGEQVLSKHALLDEFLEQASEDERQYFSFAGVRNPLDVAVSRFELRRSGEQNVTETHRAQTRFIEQHHGDFGAYFRRYGASGAEGGADVGTVPLKWQEPGFQSIDYIYRYEKLQQEFAAILERIGVQQVGLLPMRNRTAGKADFMSYYDEQTLLLAYQRYLPYMDRWGYDVPARFRSRLAAMAEVRAAEMPAPGRLHRLLGRLRRGRA